MNMFEIVLHIIFIIISMAHVIHRPLFTMSIGLGGGFKFDWVSFGWFLLGLATFINLLMDII